MTRAINFFTVGLLYFVALPLNAKPRGAPPRTITVIILDKGGQNVGTATLSGVKPRGVQVVLDVHGLPPGLHEFHIHQKPVCDPASDFNTAGLQYDPITPPYGGNEHSSHTAAAAGNPGTTLQVSGSGAAHAKVILPNLTLGNDPHSVFANGGTAIVFHAAHAAPGPARIACGVIKQHPASPEKHE